MLLKVEAYSLCFVRPSIRHLVMSISLILLMGFKWNMVYIYITVRGRAVHKNHNLTLYYVLSYLPHNHFFLGKYKSWNETWFIYRLQWEEGQNTRTIILSCILIELSSHNHLLFSEWMLVQAISWKVKKGVEMKLGLYIDYSERKGRTQEL